MILEEVTHHTLDGADLLSDFACGSGLALGIDGEAQLALGAEMILGDAVGVGVPPTFVCVLDDVE